jgi:uncharacterized protein involved in exopolysaccharide biosynthesis
LISWPIYKAECLVYIQPAPPRMMETVPEQHWPFDATTYESYIQQQVHNVTRSDVLVGAVRRLPASIGRQGGETEQAAAERLGRALEVARVGTGYQISITARASNPARAAQIANAVATSFVESASRELRAGDTERIAILREERDRVVEELATDRTEQEVLNKQLGVAAIGTATPDPYDEQIGAVRAELVKARTANDEAAAHLTSLSAGNSASSAPLDSEADELANVDAGLVSLKTSLNARRAVLISQMANLTPNHPQYKQDAAELAQINASLDAMTKDLRSRAAGHIQQRLRSDLQRTSQIEMRLNAQLAQLTAAAGGATPRLQRSNELANDIQRLENRYAAVDEQFRNLTMENNAPGADYISAPAVPPLHVTQSGVLRNAFVLVFGGLILAILAAVTAHNLDQHVYIASDVERVLGFGPMAQLPDFHQVSEGVAEEYMLRVAAAIEHAHQQGGVKSCIFTGVTTGAGATTVATRVRTLLEAMGRTTLLVDAVGAPPPEPGTQSGSTTATDLVPTQRGRRPTALLHQMAHETGKETIVLTDTAPLLVSGETEYLARFVDSAIVIIDSGTTTRAQLREVAETLQRLEVAAVGFILNRVALEKATPAFRQSMKAVEQHLESQSMSYARHTARNQAPAYPEAKAPVTRPEAPQSEAESATVAARSITPQPEVITPPDAPSERAAFDEQRIVAAAEVQTIPPLTPRPLRVTAPVRTTQSAPGPAKSRPTLEKSFIAEPLRDKPRAVPSNPRSFRIVEAITTPATARQFVQDSPVPAPPTATANSQPVEDRPARLATPPAPGPPAIRTFAETAVPDHGADPDDVPYSAASRLGGLRNLLFSLGLTHLHQEEELPAAEPEPQRRPERGPEYSTFPEPGSRSASVESARRFEREASYPLYPLPDSPPDDEEALSARAFSARVLAEPEFIRPKTITETAERETEHVQPAHAEERPDRWGDLADDIEILPSARGQYRRKGLPSSQLD